MSTFVLLTITGLGLGAMYFLVASGLSLIYGLMGVLNFAHGALITVGAYAAWWFGDQIGGGAWQRLLIGGLFGIVAGAVVAALIELVLIRPLYQRPVEQVLVTEVASALERAAELTTIVLVEQNLSVVQRLARDVVVLDAGRVVHSGPAAELLADPEHVRRLLGVHGGGH